MSSAASLRSEERKRQEDLEFLEKLRSCSTIKQLEHMLRDHKKAPRWKVAAIKRRLLITIRK